MASVVATQHQHSRLPQWTAQCPARHRDELWFVHCGWGYFPVLCPTQAFRMVVQGMFLLFPSAVHLHSRVRILLLPGISRFLPACYRAPVSRSPADLV